MPYAPRGPARASVPETETDRDKETFRPITPALAHAPSYEREPGPGHCGHRSEGNPKPRPVDNTAAIVSQEQCVKRTKGRNGIGDRGRETESAHRLNRTQYGH